MSANANTSTPTNSLDPDQRARRECLRAAREALATKMSAGAFSSAGGELPKGRDVHDLLDVARYVETGVHPLDDAPAGRSGETVTINIAGASRDAKGIANEVAQAFEREVARRGKYAEGAGERS